VRIVFLGSPADAVPPLRALVADGHDVALVVTQPDRRRSRGAGTDPTPLKRAALELGLPVVTPAKAREIVEEVRATGAEMGVVVAFGQLLPVSLLEALPHGFVNLHFSLLPRWRGAAPVERAILAGDEQTGVTIHRTVEELDAGPIAAQEAFVVGDLDAGGVYERAAELAARQLEEVLGEPVFTPQPDDGATYAEKVTPADRELDLSDPLDAWRRVRALSPHIGAWTTMYGRRLTVWRARLEDGAFVPELVQPEGRRQMTYDEFLRGVR